MAACTFAVRIAVDLRLLIPEQRIINMSRGPDAGTTEVTTRTAAICEVAAATYESRMGSAGAFDDSDSTVGDQKARSWGTRYAKHLFMDAFMPDPDPSAEGTETRLMAELEQHREMAIIENADIVTYDVDGEEVTP